MWRHCCLIAAVFILQTLVAVEAQRLFFSEYHKGANNDIAVEIFNPGCDGVDLGTFGLRIARDSVPWPTVDDMTLPSITLGLHETFLICHPGASFVAVCDHTDGSIDFSGSDAVALMENGIMLDSIGEEGYYSSSVAWKVAGLEDALTNGTLVRKASVTEGIRHHKFTYPFGRPNHNVHYSQWTASAPASTADLGKHEFDGDCVLNVKQISCGTKASDSMFGSLASGDSVLLECPIDCIEAAKITVDNFDTFLTGGKDAPFIYKTDSYICLAAIHSGVNKLTSSGRLYDNIDASQTIALCSTGAFSLLSPYTQQEATANTRLRGRPRLRMNITDESTFDARNTTCLGSQQHTGAASAFTLETLMQTTCLNDCSFDVGQGHCDQISGKCQCNTGFSGGDCSQRSCLYDCHNGGTCNTTTQRCDCVAPWHGELCTHRACTEVDCGDHGTCDHQSGKCFCDAPYFGEECLFLPCFNDCSNRGQCDINTGTCTCPDGYFGKSCQFKFCPGDCHGHGECNFETGICSCDSASFIAEGACAKGACPNDCSGHGVCNYFTRRCKCEYPWFGEDCSRDGLA